MQILTSIIKIYLFYFLLTFVLTPVLLKGFCSIIGLRGSGKSNLAALLAWFHIHIRHREVYSNFPIRECHEYNVSDLGTYMIENVVLILDEAGIDLSNRKVLEKSMKGIKENNRKFWKLSRHYHIPDIYIFSQAKDYDVTLRRLCSTQCIITGSNLTGISMIHLTKQHWMPTQEGDDVTIGLEILKFPHLRVLRKHWFKYYDSYEVDILPYKEFPKYKFTDIGNYSLFRSRGYIPIRKRYKRLHHKKKVSHRRS